VAENPTPQDVDLQIDLKDPVIAGFLAWLVPGLGHLYQGRTGKAVLFFVCIFGTFTYGAYLASSATTGYARNVYLSFRANDLRLPYLCQVGVGLPTMPALFQANLFYNGKPPKWNDFMAPPKLSSDPRDATDPKTLSGLYRYFPRTFELGTVYTMVAGLLNVLAIYDACCGPVVLEPAKKEDEEPAVKDEAKSESPDQGPIQK
jgi:hypothetical protein